jgi:hypothetical protein
MTPPTSLPGRQVAPYLPEPLERIIRPKPRSHAGHRQVVLDERGGAQARRSGGDRWRVVDLVREGQFLDPLDYEPDLFGPCLSPPWLGDSR